MLAGAPINVIDFGAVGNNTNNDVSAINAALAGDSTVVQFDTSATGYVYAGGTVVYLQYVAATTVVTSTITNLTNGVVYLNMFGSYIST